ncbi:Exosome complex component CSL4 [Cucumis melo var. makuwa]|uniref:Exosome complex component CSL4 n=1 Tax=Cucumis melo var. makuwa TaxID=1194695 RepID=A0A5A7T7Y2_CUCMM|nr:Exosome complex component CSL4 [Cucumis melo var. makuwa]
MFDQEISGIQAELHKLPTIEENLMSLAKSIERLGMQAEKQHQLLLKYVESMAKEKSTMSEGVTESASQGSAMAKTIEEGSTPMKEIGSEGRTTKIEIEENLNRYFQIYKLTDSEKLIVVVISFDRAALDGYRLQEERNAFKDWAGLKQRLLVRFRSVKEAPLPQLPKEVLEETFVNRLTPWIKDELECWGPFGLAQMMKLAQKVENREITRREANLKENMTITLRRVTADENRQEGPAKRLSNAEFQARRDKGLCFRCDERYHAEHKYDYERNKEMKSLEVKEDVRLIVEEVKEDVRTERGPTIVPKWPTKLLGYDFEILYQPGLQNKAVDALSRMESCPRLNTLSTPRIVDLEVVLKEVEEDDELQKLIEDLKENPKEENKCQWENGRLLYKRKTVYGRSLPPLISYGDRKTPNNEVESLLKERGLALKALKKNLCVAQNRRKKMADLKRGELKFKVGEEVYLKLRLYRQRSLARKKLSQFKKMLGEDTEVQQIVSYICLKLMNGKQYQKEIAEVMNTTGKLLSASSTPKVAEEPQNETRMFKFGELQVELTADKANIGAAIGFVFGVISWQLSQGVQSIRESSLQYANENALLLAKSLRGALLAVSYTSAVLSAFTTVGLILLARQLKSKEE